MSWVQSRISPVPVIWWCGSLLFSLHQRQFGEISHATYIVIQCSWFHLSLWINFILCLLLSCHLCIPKNFTVVDPSTPLFFLFHHFIHFSRGVWEFLSGEDVRDFLQDAFGSGLCAPEVWLSGSDFGGYLEDHPRTCRYVGNKHGYRGCSRFLGKLRPLPNGRNLWLVNVIANYLLSGMILQVMMQLSPLGVAKWNQGPRGTWEVAFYVFIVFKNNLPSFHWSYALVEEGEGRYPPWN